MISGRTILAIIPARGGSKGVPKKNLRLLGNKPLIGWTIDEAKKSKYIDRIIVSTDSQEIADFALKFGAEVPFIRPKELAQDETPSSYVIIHTIEWLDKNQNQNYDILILQDSYMSFI